MQLSSRISHPPPMQGGQLPEDRVLQCDFLHRSISCPALVLLAVLILSTLSSWAAILVNLDATVELPGLLSTWTNRGSLSGNFISAGTQIPSVVVRDRVPAVALTLSDEATLGTFYNGPIAPQELIGNSARSVEAWVFDATAQPEENVIAWGRRGGPDGSSFSFGHGTDVNFGAVLHWGALDMSWGKQITFGRWTYITYTYSPSTSLAVIYQDGVQVNSTTVVLDTWGVDGSFQAAPLPIRVGRQSTVSGAPSRVGIGDCIIARIRVHDAPLTEEEILARFRDEAPLFGLDDADGDGIPSWFERRIEGLDPLNPTDAKEDLDGDGLNNLDEYFEGTPLLNPDADGDGLSDGDEVLRIANGQPAPTNPFVADTDQDGVPDSLEIALGTDPLRPDTDGDGFSDGQEIIHGSSPNDRNSIPDLTRPAVVFELDPLTFQPGTPSVWTDQGELGANFFNRTGNPFLVSLDGMPAVVINDLESALEGPPAPIFLTGNSPRTITAWVWNAVSEAEETLVAWGSRGPEEGSNMAFGHGSSPAFGAVGHWGTRDLGWDGKLVNARWTHIAYVYDPSLQSSLVFVDGVEANRKAVGILRTEQLDENNVRRGLRIRIGAQNEPDGTRSGVGPASLSIGSLRIYDGSLSGADIRAEFEREAEVFGVADFDKDGLPNVYERQYPFLDPSNPADADLDFDGDGLSNFTEFRLRTDPSKRDTDGDGVSDGDEVNRRVNDRPAPTDPRRSDTDGDGLSDGEETNTGIYRSPTNTGTDPLVSDTDQDGYGDGQEVAWDVDPLTASSRPQFEPDLPYLELDARSLQLGAVSRWVSTGLNSTAFRAVGSSATAEDIEGVRAVVLDGQQVHFIGPTAPSFLCGNSPRTIEAWIYNSSASSQETLIAWGLPGHGEGANAAFSHGTNPTSGAFVHGGNLDMSWDQSVLQGVWTQVAYVYDPATRNATIYSDGEIIQTREVGPLQTSLFERRPTGTNGVPIRIGAQNDSAGGASTAGRGSMAVARLRVFDQALSPSVIRSRYQQEAGNFPRESISLSVVQLLNQRIELTWRAAVGGRFSVERSDDLILWHLLAVEDKPSHIEAVSAGAGGLFFRVRRLR